MKYVRLFILFNVFIGAFTVSIQFLKHCMLIRYLLCQNKCDFHFKFQLLNILMLNVIIPEFWSRYSQAISALLTGYPKNWMFHSELIFPRAAKCTYEPYGPSGSIQNFDALCLLPLNILNQKLLIIL